MPVESRFSSIFILFPDPWPKRRHSKNRLVTPAFVEAVAGRAEPGALLCLRTDAEPYFREMAAAVGSSAAWSPEPGRALPFEEPTVFQQRAARQFTLVARRGGGAA